MLLMQNCVQQNSFPGWFESHGTRNGLRGTRNGTLGIKNGIQYKVKGQITLHNWKKYGPYLIGHLRNAQLFEFLLAERLSTFLSSPQLQLSWAEIGLFSITSLDLFLTSLWLIHDLLIVSSWLVPKNLNNCLHVSIFEIWALLHLGLFTYKLFPTNCSQLVHNLFMTSSHVYIFEIWAHVYDLFTNFFWLFPDFSWLLARACGVPAVGVRAVDCWQWRSGHYFHPSFLLFFPFSLRRDLFS